MSCSAQKRYLLAISGTPGAGKTVLTSFLAENLNAKWRSAGNEGELCVVVGVDGWHHTRAELDVFPDPSEAHRRRGALFTFNGPSYLRFVTSLRSDTTSSAPSFSHSLKDPVEDAIAIKPLPEHKLVILEGLWTTMGGEGEGIKEWAEAASLCDERWVVLPTPISKGGEGEEGIRERLIARHVRTGVAPSLEEATIRADTSDIPNGRYLLDHLLEPVKRIYTMHDPSFIIRGEEIEIGAQ
ncbi:hypothetical protein BT69DRAFT_1356817 [Atractiella rhizophila]|nr:hypothetical protein BT69DRAFT_1356817 [Atractiella rhizophila]